MVEVRRGGERIEAEVTTLDRATAPAARSVRASARKWT